MSKHDGPWKHRCDCAIIFPHKLLLSQHIQQTGHMKARWCATCQRLFPNTESLQQHKNKAARHENDQADSKAHDISPSKFQTSRPNASTNKPAATAKTAKTPNAAMSKPTTPTKARKASTSPKVSKDVKGKKVQEKVPKSPTKGVVKSSPAVQKSPLAAIIPAEPAMIVSDTKYPWASKSEDPNLFTALESCCHDPGRLHERGFYTGNAISRKGIKAGFATFLQTPARVNGIARRKAIALDCEMVGIAGGKDEIVQLCAVDLFSGEILIDSLVLPLVTVKDWRTRHSGVTASMMDAARVRGEALDGWPAARAKLYEFADADTILIGHSLDNDLKVLHMAHSRVVDSAIVVAEAVFGKHNRLGRLWGLKVLSRDLLGATIQMSKNGHDCLEDTLATRELVLFCLRQPEQLEAWAKKTLVQHEIEKKKRMEEQNKKNVERANQKRKEMEMAKKTSLPAHHTR
ncbi:hypothetical protein Hte_008416 [Hypoxylon texense]